MGKVLAVCMLGNWLGAILLSVLFAATGLTNGALGEYMAASAQAKMNMNEIIEIKNINVNLDEYEKVLLGTGVWWYKITPAIRSFLNKYDLKDKVIVPFITNGGWFGEALDDDKRYVKECNIKDAITMKNSNKVKSWIEGL